MFCTKCGKQIEDGSRFCPYCGMPQGKTGDLSEGQKIPNIHRMSNASHVPHTPSEPNVQNTSKASARAIENFIIKFMAADWANKVYFILAVIFSVRIAVFLIPEIFVFPWTINWMSIRGIIAACLVYYGTAALIVDTAVYWFRGEPSSLSGFFMYSSFSLPLFVQVVLIISVFRYFVKTKKN